MSIKKKVLTLSVSKQWFDMLKADEKKEEYREIKPFWVARLFYCRYGKIPSEQVKELTKFLKKDKSAVGFEHENGVEVYLVPFTHVLFINGYGDDKPRVEKEIDSISIGKPKKGWCPDEFLDKEYFVIKLK